ncbi:hypothetical protein AXF42_Ash013806 [Apostasia shenzhenica]|uniref:Gamma-interferon-inducible lysosomal thiol reductase n=1 Tax=Apostasia shenzhenica TaxID=1088818 RepID=A0A2I0A4X8_9ASPA|nr:hypothetical protein AXF42_Ash013806 [Apostasia shenzhenica]
MASLRHATVFVLLSFSLFLGCSTASAAPNVSLALYYEALCPFCSRFVVLSLSKIFRDGLSSIVDLRLVPYGNSRIGSNSSISCQHGPSECLLNTVEACAIYVWPNVKVHFSYIFCVESLVLENKYNEWKSCFQKTGLDPQPLMNCYSSWLGQKIEHQYATQTNALLPALRYVPWVVVNGLPLYDDYDNFENYICKSYNGELPDACGSLPLRIPQQREADGANEVCLLNDKVNSSLAANKNQTHINFLI